MKPFLSICIPSYNRPVQLYRLLQSIKIKDHTDIEIVICEDRSPKRKEIIDVCNKFKENSGFCVNLHLNESNLGYDENLKELIRRSRGEYVMYMGDDDLFHDYNLDSYIRLLKKNKNLGYILRRYSVIHNNGLIEEFKYYPETVFFEPGINSFIKLFRKSVFISGFCFKRDFVLEYFETTRFKGTLLFQLFLCGRLVLDYPSAYFDIPLTIMDEGERGVPEFGSSANEVGKYTPGEITMDNSLNFMKSFLVITGYFDEKFNFNATELFLKDLSKYSYPVLSIQRDNGIPIFIKYNYKLISELKLNNTIYYYIYFFSLLFLGKNNCDRIILFFKKVLGRTPKL